MDKSVRKARKIFKRLERDLNSAEKYVDNPDRYPKKLHDVFESLNEAQQEYQNFTSLADKEGYQEVLDYYNEQTNRAESLRTTYDQVLQTETENERIKQEEQQAHAEKKRMEEEHQLNEEKRKAEEDEFLYTHGNFLEKLLNVFETTQPRIIEANENEYTFSSTQRLLEMDGWKSRQLKETYDKVSSQLNDNPFIEAYHNKIDEQFQYADDKLSYLNGLNDSIKMVQEFVFPDENAINDVLYYLHKLIKLQEDKETVALDGVVCSDLHKKYLNRIVFTDQALKPVEALTEQDCKDFFLPGETIRGIAFLDNTFKNIYGEYATHGIELVGEFFNIETEEFTKADQNKGYVSFTLMTHADDYQAPPHANVSSVEKFMTHFSKFQPRIKNIEIKLNPFGTSFSGVKVSEIKGAFKFDASDTEGMQILENNLNVVKTIWLKKEKLPAAHMHNPEIEQELVSLFNQLAHYEGHYTQAIILSRDFFALKNYESVTTARALGVAMVSEHEGKNYFQTFDVAQDPIGDSWSKFRIHGVGDKKEFILN